MHGTVLPQVPLDVHDWTPLPLHCVCPGAQTPTHAPLMQVLSTQATGEPQLPPAVHVS